MQYKEVLELMQRFDSLSMDVLVWEDADGRLELRKGASGHAVSVPPVLNSAAPVVPEPEPVQTQAPAEDARYVTAPLVGVFYLQAGPGRPPFVHERAVQKGRRTVIRNEEMWYREIDGVIEEVLGRMAKWWPESLQDKGEMGWFSRRGKPRGDCPADYA